MKVKFLTSLIGPTINYQTGVIEDIENDEGCKLTDNGIVEPADKKAKEIYAFFLENKKEQKEQKEQKERQVAAILEKEFLENKRTDLQSQVDAITHILDDAATYYKPYSDLAEDLAKKEAEELAKKEAEDLAKKQGDEEK